MSDTVTIEAPTTARMLACCAGIAADGHEPKPAKPGTTAAEYIGMEEAAPVIRAPRKLTLRLPDEILGMKFDDSDRILGDRLLAKGQNATLCGASSVGKSRLSLQLAAGSITGRQFLTFETRGVNLKWLFIQAENSNRRLQFDLAKLRAWIGEYDWPVVNERLIIHTLESDDDGFLNLDDEGNRLSISEMIQDTKPDVAVFDSLYNVGIGDLNHDADMFATLRAVSFLTKTGNPERVPLVLHHALTGKAGAAKATGYDRASFSRNSKVLHAWTRGQINVSAGSPDNNDTLILSCGKCSNGREFEPFAVRLNPETFIYEPDPAFDMSAWQSDMTGKKLPKRAGTREDLLALVPLEKTVNKALLIDQWKDRYGNKDKGRAFLESLVGDGSLYEWRIKRTGTNDARLISRYPQPKQNL
jgi:hypothetical protein